MEVPPLGHDFPEAYTVDTPTTCTAPGSQSIHCTRCGGIKPDSAIDIAPTGHTPAAEYTVDTPATCTTPGSKSRHCTVCGEIVDGTQEMIATTEHTWNKDYTVDTPATTEHAGQKSIHCSVCNTVKPGSEVVLPKIDPKPTVNFKDVSKKAWYYDAVAYTVSKGIFAGITPTTFEPDTPMTRAMFVATLSRMAGVKVSNKVTTKFSDVKSGQWYTGAVKWASDNGIVKGSDGKFSPNDPITREQICTIFVTYAKYKKVTLTPKQAAVTFKDAKKISKWAKAAVTTCQRAGLVEGSNGNFDPQGKATRAAVAQIIMNFDKNFG